MGYKSLLTYISPGRDNDSVCTASARLADVFDACVIGISGMQLAQTYSEMPAAGLAQNQWEAAEQTLKACEKEFRAAFKGKTTSLSWRAACSFGPLSDYVASEARAADLLIIAAQAPSLLEQMGENHVGALALQAGRPVLVVPRDQKVFNLGKVVVAWKDTRESRRAISDALPLLEKAGSVVVVEVCDPTDAEAAGRRLDDVVHWLKGHGVVARAVAEICEDRDLDGLYRFLQRENCDLVVAGAYGHTRLREWIFGGVTMDLLLPARHCMLLSH